MYIKILIRDYTYVYVHSIYLFYMTKTDYIISNKNSETKS